MPLKYVDKDFYFKETRRNFVFSHSAGEVVWVFMDAL